jgi:hypothetical protein
MKWLLLCMLAGCAPDPCAGIAGACLALHIDPSTVREVEQLDFDITYGTDHGTATSRAPSGQTITLPAVTAIAAQGQLRIKISGVLGGAIAGRAQVSRTLMPGEHASERVQLGSGAVDLGSTCTIGGVYCGGNELEGDPNTLYKCTATGPVIRGACVGGCEIRAAGKDDACRGVGGPCVIPGRYCGGDKLPGDPQVLYRCDGTQMPPVVMSCQSGCQIRPGDDDECL